MIFVPPVLALLLLVWPIKQGWDYRAPTAATLARVYLSFLILACAVLIVLSAEQHVLSKGSAFVSLCAMLGYWFGPHGK